MADSQKHHNRRPHFNHIFKWENERCVRKSRVVRVFLCSDSGLFLLVLRHQAASRRETQTTKLKLNWNQLTSVVGSTTRTPPPPTRYHGNPYALDCLPFLTSVPLRGLLPRLSSPCPPVPTLTWRPPSPPLSPPCQEVARSVCLPACSVVTPGCQGDR